LITPTKPHANTDEDSSSLSTQNTSESPKTFNTTGEESKEIGDFQLDYPLLIENYFESEEEICSSYSTCAKDL